MLFPLRRRLGIEPLEDRRLLSITVDTLVDENNGIGAGAGTSLREAIAAAAAGETIDFSVSGTINLTLGQLTINKALTIAGPGAELLTIDAAGNDPTPDENNGDGSRVFNINDGTSAVRAVAVNGVTLTGGDVSGSGGAVFNSENLTLNDAAVTANSASDRGGGIFSSGFNSRLTLSSSTVSGNSSTSGKGGGVYGSGAGAVLNINESTVSGNSAINNSGGGVAAVTARLNVTDSTVTGNSAAQHGGGIDTHENQATVTGSRISGNTANFRGGGVSIGATTISITNSEITENASPLGGGIWNYGTLNVSDSAISENRASSFGGGIGSTGSLNVTTTTISGNSASYAGGGIDSRYGRLTVTGTTVVGNTSTQGSGGGIFNQSSFLRIAGSTISGNSAATGAGVFTSSAEATIIDSTVSGNESTYHGGGVFSYGALTVNNSIIDGNRAAERGGGISSFGGLTVSGSVISGNQALSGGGIHSRYGNLSVTGSAIRYNSARSNGGGIYSGRYNNLTLTGSTLVGNTAGTNGGGIFSRQHASAQIVNSTLSGNQALGGSGGGLYLFNSGPGAAPFAVRHSTFHFNSASSFGGGVASVGGALELDHTIDATNFAAFAPDLASVFGSVSARFSLIGDGTGSGLAATPANLPDANGNVIGPALLVEPLVVYVEMAAMGDFEAGSGGDSFLFEYSVDGGPFQPLFTISVDEGGSQTYFMDSGAQIVLADPLVVDGVPLNRFFQGFSAVIPEAGAQLQIRFTATNDGPNEAFAWRNLFIYAANSGQFVGSAVQFEASFDQFAAYSADPDYSVAGDMFGIRSRLETGTPGLPADVVDDSTVFARPDAQGIISQFDTARFFGVVDTVNGVGSDTNVATWTFDDVLVPIDPLLLPLSDNAGPILPDGSVLLTHALLPGSPALDAGDPAAVAGAGGVPQFDQRGGPFFTRVADGDGDGDPRIDIGAVEQQSLRIVVDTLADEDDGNFSAGDLSLREALGVANRNPVHDMIEFDSDLAGGSISLTLGELAIFDAVTIAGLGAGALTIDASGNDPTPIEANGDGSRVFFVSAPEAEIRGLTLTGGDTYSGGAILNFGDLTVAECTITGNAAIQSGGGIENRYGQLTLSGSTISGNTAQYGGGIALRYAYSLNVTGSTISGNTADVRGGGIYAQYAANIQITGSAIRDNSASGDGGGIAAFRSRLAIRDSTLSFNHAGESGGGLALETPSGEFKTAVVNSTISGNTAGFAGGGVYWLGGELASLTFGHSTISQNSARLGGGVFVAAGAASLDHAIVAQNIGQVAPDITGLFGFTIDARYSLVGSNAGSGLTEAPVGAPDANGNLVGGPSFASIDAGLLPLADNDGPLLRDGSRLQTHALMAVSPAVDAGDAASVAGVDGVPEFDQRGAPYARVVDGDLDDVPRIDIGAFEVAPQTFVVDTLVDENDGDHSPGDVSLREAILLAESSAGIDRIMFDPGLAGGTILLTHGELAINDSLQIVGLGRNLLTISARGNDPTPATANGDGSRSFHVFPQALLEIHGLTITGGDTFIGGAILNDSGRLTVVDSTITGNATTFAGGGIDNRYGALTVIDSTISGNAANYLGGGIYSLGYGVTVSISGSTISRNAAASRGGGIFSRSGVLTITDTTISGNTASFSGGGIEKLYGILNINGGTISGNIVSNRGGGVSASGATVSVDGAAVSSNIGGQYGGGLFASFSAVTVTRSSIRGNSAALEGGGILSFYADTTVMATTISGNTARHGGGVYVQGGNTRVSDSTISGNMAPGPSGDGRGGGIYSRFGSTQVNNSTISGNTANHRGGGIYTAAAANLAVRHSTISANTAGGDGGGLMASANETLSHTIVAGNSRGQVSNDVSGTVALDFSLLRVNTGTAVTNNGGNLIGTAASPVDPQLGPLAENGGPTRTHALLDGSPAMNAGNAAVLPGIGGVPEFDQRGAPFTRVDGGRVDIGAAESQPSPAPALAGDFNQDGAVDAADYVMWRKTLRSVVPSYSGADGDGDGAVDQDDYGVWRANFGRTLAAESGEQGAGSGDERSIVSFSRGPQGSVAAVRGQETRAQQGTAGQARHVEFRATSSGAQAGQTTNGTRTIGELLRRDDALVAWAMARTSGDKARAEGIYGSFRRGDWDKEFRESVFEAVDSVFDELSVGVARSDSCITRSE